MLNPLHTSMPRFGSMPHEPLTVMLHKNQIANRFVVDTLGYSAWSVILARNSYERYEKAGDWAAWVAAGFVLPYLLQTFINRRYTQKLQKRFALPVVINQRPSSWRIPFQWLDKAGLKGLSGDLEKIINRRYLKNLQKRFSSPIMASPLCMPFEWLDKAGFKLRVAQMVRNESVKSSPALKALGQIGLKSFRQLTPKLADKVLQGKLLILWANLFIMATKGQTYLWAKNWMTEKLSGRKGFSGEFKYASNDYLKQKSSGYEKNKKKRMIISMTLGFGSAFLLPGLVYGILKSPMPKQKAAQMIMSHLKKLVTAFNYTDAIFMSKWVLLWINLFNWALPTLLASRDNHEFHENLNKMLVFDSFFFLGDDIFAGVAGHFLHKKYGRKLETPIVKYLGKIKLPRAVSVNRVFEKVGGNTKALSYRLARTSFWAGIFGTSLVLGIMTPLVNYWYTHKKVTEEQALLLQQRGNTPLKPSLSTGKMLSQ